MCGRPEAHRHGRREVRLRVVLESCIRGTYLYGAANGWTGAWMVCQMRQSGGGYGAGGLSGEDLGKPRAFLRAAALRRRRPHSTLP